MVMNFAPCPTFSICATKVFLPNEQHITRRYNKSVLILMMDGELRFLEDGKLIMLTAGEYYIQREGLFQQGVPLATQPIYFFIEFNACYSERQAGLPLRGTFEAKKIVSIMETCEELFFSRKANAFKLNSYMLRIFSELLGSNDAISGESQTLARYVGNYIDSQYTSPINLADISKKFGYTEEYLSRIFKRHYHMSPHQYLIKLRMEHARWLLENTNNSAEQIALLLGYGDYSVFYKNFRKTFGTSPTALQHAKKEKE